MGIVFQQQGLPGMALMAQRSKRRLEVWVCPHCGESMATELRGVTCVCQCGHVMKPLAKANPRNNKSK